MIKELLDEYVGATKKIFTGRQATVGASEIGLCARKTAWMKASPQGAAHRDGGHVESWGAHVRGTMMEQHFWHPAVKRKFGKRLQLSQQTIRDEVLSATPDGLVTGLPRDFLRDLGVKDLGADGSLLVECKTIDPRVNLAKEKDENAFQVQVQLGLVRKKTRHKPEHALISYIDASFWNEVLEFPVKFDPRIFQVAEERARKILSTPPKDLAPEGWIAGGKECEYCPFTKQCGVIRRSVPAGEAAADPQFAAEVADACREILALEAEAAELAARVRAKEQELKDRLREKGVRKVPKVVVWSSVKGRTSYDNKGIREAAAARGVDVESYSTAGEPTDRLQIFPSAGRAP